jgi:hypothetical protein
LDFKVFLSNTTDRWQAAYGGQLTREDARQIVENVTGYFDLLANWESNSDLGGHDGK